MLSQLIYTRCFPHRDLKNKGRVVHADGFGVFSASPELFSSTESSSFDFLQARLAIPNGAKETAPIGLFDSYEYNELTANTFALTFEVARPLCKEPRKNGRTHRTGTYIKQCLVGTPDSYPFAWFGAKVWDACQKTENDYYLDTDPNPTPPLLPLIDDWPEGGYVTLEKVKQFAADGRQAAVKAGIWFLLHEAQKPEGERRVLLIKDMPDNVELWIAAIEYGFSVQMAKEITFATNRSKLGTQADSILFYYTDSNGKFYPMQNRSIQQTRHPYCMIVGYHPKDVFCASLKQMPTSNFVILDGTTKTAAFPTDADIQAPYYSAAVQYGADIQDFCRIVLPTLPVRKITSALPHLYDAYKYLLDANHRSNMWCYPEAVSHLKVLLQFGMPKDGALCSYLLDEFLAVAPVFLAEDLRSGCVLLKMLWALASTVSRKNEVTKCVGDLFAAALRDLHTDGQRLASMWSALKEAGLTEIAMPALKALFADTALPIHGKQIDHSSAVAIDTVTDIFFAVQQAENVDWRRIPRTDPRYDFVQKCIIAALDMPAVLNRLLQKLLPTPEVFNPMCLSVAAYIEKEAPQKAEQWWESVTAACGGNVLNLCQALIGSKTASIDLIEYLLTNQVYKSHRMDAELLKTLGHAAMTMGKNSDTGGHLFAAWIEVGTVNEASRIIKAVQSFGPSKNVEIRLFQMLDRKIPYDSKANPGMGVYNDMRAWASHLNLVSTSAEFYMFRHDLERIRQPEKAVERMDQFAGYRFEIARPYIDCGYSRDLMERAADFCDAEVHITWLCVYFFRDKELLTYFVDAYTGVALEKAGGRRMPIQMISLCEASFYRYKIKEKKPTYIEEVQALLRTSFENYLVNYYKPSLEEQVAKANTGSPEVKKQLILMLRSAAQKARPQKPGGFLSNLFGKK